MENHTNWLDQNLKNYKYTIEHCTYSITTAVDVTVENGVVVETKTQENLRQPSPNSQVEIDEHLETMKRHGFLDGIDQVFSYIIADAKSDKLFCSTQFDKRYSFPTRFSKRYVATSGGDSFTIENFETNQMTVNETSAKSK